MAPLSQRRCRCSGPADRRSRRCRRPRRRAARGRRRPAAGRRRSSSPAGIGAVVEDLPEPAFVDELLGQRDGGDAAVVVPDDVRHAGLLDGLRPSPRLRPRSSPAAFRRGSSCRPRPRRWRSRVCSCSACRCRRRRCRRARPASASRSRPIRSPTSRRSSSTVVLVAAADGLEHRLVFEVEEVVDLAVGIRVGAAHEAVADHADVELVCAHVCRSVGLCSPAVCVAHLDHGRQDVVPGLRLHHDVVGEHAAVPADVLERPWSARRSSSRSQ